LSLRGASLSLGADDDGKLGTAMGCSGSKDVHAQSTTVTVALKQITLGVSTPISAMTPASAKADIHRRHGISAEASARVYKKVVYFKSDEAKAMIAAATKESKLFASLTEAQMAEVVDAMQEVTHCAGQSVILQGDVGDNFYVVGRGEYAAYLQQASDKAVKTYAVGGMFGELALMYNSPRAASVVATSDSACWALDQHSFRGILMAAAKEALDTTAKFLQAVSLLSALTDAQREALGEVLEVEKYAPNETIVHEGDEADSLYLIKSGECIVYQSDLGNPLGKELCRMRQPECLGEYTLEAPGQKWPATIVSADEVTMLKLTRANFTELLGELQEVIRFNFNQKVLSSMEIFKELSERQRESLVESLREASFAKGTPIIRQGEELDPSSAFYIIKTGAVTVTRLDDKGEVILIKDKLGPSDYFGEMALMSDETRMATVTATSPTICMKLDRATFKQLLGDENPLLAHEAAKRRTELTKASRPKIDMSELQHGPILGVGTFGRVRLVVHGAQVYALKCMRKGQLIALQQVEHVMNEKTLLEQCDHPFILRLFATYQDADEIYMLLELALGGELFSLLRELECFDEPQSCFYAACVYSAFAYMHDRRIAYRDLKPENLLFDASGYLKVCDFGFAKKIIDRTWTLCGTPEYLAPEILSNKGHGLPVDWWAFGILIFEMLVGQPPFCADDPMDIYAKILKNRVTYPHSMSKAAKGLITLLLVTMPAQRLGSLKRGHRDIAAHPFFGKLDWAALLRKAEPAPFTPRIRNPTDTSNFEHYEDVGVGKWARYNDRRCNEFEGF